MPLPDALGLPTLRRWLHSTPWAITPDALDTILEVVHSRAEGIRLSPQDIDARIAAAGGRRDPVRSTGSGVAVIPVSGVITPKATLMSQWSGGTSLEDLGAALDAAARDPDVSRIILNVDSPGGSVSLVPETAAKIRGIDKPVTAVANTLAASAAYWLACACDEIIVTPSGTVGSIGVLAAHEDVSAAQEKDGVKTTLVSAGRFKTDGNPYEPLTESHREWLQAMVDETYGEFVDAVAEGRGVTTKHVSSGFGEGRTVSANRALTLGMVDGVATLQETIVRHLRTTSSTGAAARADDQLTDMESEELHSTARAVEQITNSLKEADPS